MDERDLKVWLSDLEASARNLASQDSRKALPKMPHVPDYSRGYGGHSGFRPMLSPGSRRNYERHAGDLWRNSVVAICLGWMSDNFGAAIMRVVLPGDDQGDDEILHDHPLPRLVGNPNDFYNDDALWSATLLSFAVDGNAYWIKARNPEDESLLDLWWEPHWNIEPYGSEDGQTFLEGYMLRRPGMREIRLDPADVVHFRDGIDPYNPLKGCARLKHITRAIAGHNGAESFNVGLVLNMGVPGVVISPADPDGTLDDDVANQIERRYGSAQGDGAGGPLVLSIPVKTDQLSMSPQDLAIESQMDRYESTIAAALGVNPMVAGLAAGATMRSYANQEEANQQSWQNGLVPRQTRMAKALTPQLLHEDFDAPEGSVVQWDYSRVPALNENEDAKADRAIKLFTTGLASKRQALAILGMEPDDEALPESDTEDTQDNPDEPVSGEGEKDEFE